MLTPEQIAVMGKVILVMTVIYCLYGLWNVLKGDA